MKTLAAALIALAIYPSAVCLGQGQDGKPVEASRPAVSRQAPANLRVQWHRTVAELVEAQAAETPDQAKIAKLQSQMAALRSQLQAGSPADRRADWVCPWGGPGPGFGPPPWAGGGRGWGRGPGRGPGSGAGRGAGWGPAFVDQDGDGVCDNYQRAQGQR